MKLCELQIKNFGCIGDTHLKVKIDNIVVLIGANNVGKSTVLDAYEAFQGGGTLAIENFHNSDEKNTIEIIGIFNELNQYDIEQIGSKWNYIHPQYGDAIQYKYVWDKADSKGVKYSWSNEENDWIKGGMGGWDTKIASCIPQPLKINPFDSSDVLEKQIIEILTAAVKEKIKKDNSKLSGMINKLNDLANEVHSEISESLNSTTNRLENNLNDVFPNYKVKIQPEAGKFEADKIIASGSHVRITDPKGNEFPLDKQGTGLQRTFLWSAIESLADSDNLKVGKKPISSDSPRILLVEEPESFLHPPAIRAAREALYKIAELENWQVIITTHSPIFIDVSKEHTTIIRVDKTETGMTRTFSTDKAGFDEDERKRLQMIRACNPSVNEFFFTDKIVLVEGETEQAIFQSLKNADVNLHILNCFGKANIPMFQRILNHFGVGYVVIHDTDSPKSKRDGKWIKNAMWSLNQSIYEESLNNSQVVNIVLASVPDLEVQYFGHLQKGDKPYQALLKVSDNEFIKSKEYQSLYKLANFIDVESSEYRIKDISDYKNRVIEFSRTVTEDKEKWEF